MKKTESVTKNAVLSKDDVQKKLDVFVEEFKGILNDAQHVITRLCKVCADAAAICGEAATKARFEKEFDAVSRIGFKYFLMAGQGRSFPEIITIGMETSMENIASLPIEQQRSFFKDGIDVVDFKTEKVVRKGYNRLNQVEWQEIWDGKIGALRGVDEQLAWVHCKKIENNRRPRWRVKKDGKVQILRACTLTLEDVAAICFEIGMKCGVSMVDMMKGIPQEGSK